MTSQMLCYPHGPNISRVCGRVPKTQQLPHSPFFQGVLAWLLLPVIAISKSAGEAIIPHPLCICVGKFALQQGSRLAHTSEPFTILTATRQQSRKTHDLSRPLRETPLFVLCSIETLGEPQRQQALNSLFGNAELGLNM